VRRSALVTGLAAVLAPAGLAGPGGVTAQESAAGDLAGVERPPSDLGQSDLRVYVGSTGHTLAGVMLDYWRASGAVFGDPISEPFAAANGYYSQAFERGILQYRPEFLFTVEPILRPMPLGRMALAASAGALRADGKRAGGGGDPLADAWLPNEPGDGLYVEATGHTVGGAFREWYERYEGDYYLGPPLGEATEERGRTVQWFEGGQLIEEGDGVVLAPLGREMAEGLGIETEPVPQGDLPGFAEDLFLEAGNPYPLGAPGGPGPKRIEVDLSEQRIWAYQGDVLVTSSLVTTGLEPNETEQGRFRVRLKYPEQDMAGFTSATGEVLAGDDGSDTPVPGAVGSYEVDDVPHVMYINMDAEALHGAYWRDTFGYTGSHGCINLPVDLAAFLYGWAPLGTQVIVRE
jgi:hypothetical protein